MRGILKPWSWLGQVHKYKYNSRYFRRSLIMILLIASIPGFIIGTSIYWVASNNLEEELQQLHQNQIQQRASNIDDQLAYLELTFSHWAFDPKFDDKLKTLDIAYQFEQVQELYRTLLIMEGAHPLLENVELFLDKPKPMIFNKDRYTYLTESGLLQPYEALLKRDKSVFWTNAYPTLQAGGKTKLSLVNKIPGGSTEPFGAIVATINQDNLIKMLKTLTPYNEGETMLMTGDGAWKLSSGGSDFAELDAALEQEFGKHSSTAESFLFEHRKTSYSVSYGKFSRLGTTWIYISAAPLTSITKPVVLVSKWILFISLGGLGLALLLSWFVSQRIYSPVERLARLLAGGERAAEHRDEFDLFEKEWNHLSRESESLRSKLSEQLPLLREGFFLQLVQGHFFSSTETELRERMKHYGWRTDDLQFITLMFQLTGFANVQGRFSPGDEELVTFTAANIIQELTGKQYEQAELINFHNFSIGLLLSFPLEHPAGWVEQDLQRFCEEASRAISRILKMQVTISISRWTTQTKHIPQLFEEARQALVYRDLTDDHQIIRTDHVTGEGTLMDSSYPFTLEKEIIHAVRSGQEPEACELIGQFVKELSEGGSTELVVQQGMLQLLGSVRYAILQSGINPVQLFGGANLFEQLTLIKEPEEMLKWFRHKVVAVFVQELISRQDFHLKQMVEKVILHLREHYMTMLSLDSCAEQFGTSPYTLSRAFKQITGINFIDYLTQIRIDSSKALLRETELKINEVAERVGYQHTYFNRIFKKYEGITPSQFREMNRA